MNKKLLFAALSLAALTACTSDDLDLESQGVVAEQTSPIQFEIVNDNDALTRASMSGNKVVFSAKDGDLFTLYHGGELGTGDPITLTKYQNATYKAAAEDGKSAVLTTPSMILNGSAVMVWPTDTAFINGDNTKALAISISADQKADIENYIPYVSDVINIGTYAKWDDATSATQYNVAGKDRKYPVYMRPMGSQLIINADYVGTETIEALYKGGSKQPAEGGIDPIEVTSMELLTTEGGGSTNFTTKIPLTFTAAATADDTRWNTTAGTKVANNAWTHVTGFGTPDATTAVDKLTTECLIANNGGAKFLVLPQAKMTTDNQGVADAAIVVNTTYGKVVVAANGVHGSQYASTPTNESADAWYRYISTTATGTDATAQDGETKAATATAGKGYKTTANVELGLKQFFNTIFDYKHKGTSTVQTEPEGVAANRYVKVLLKYLDMSDLHIKSDKQLRDAAYVWQAMGAKSVTVYLDGDKTNKQFTISQSTINVISTLNAKDPAKQFTVKPCEKTGEVCETIIITGGGEIKDIPFIVANAAKTPNTAAVQLNAGETWNWPAKGAGTTASPYKVKIGDGVSKIINKGTLVNNATATLANWNAVASLQTNIPLVNDGTWNITGGDVNVQFDVTNNGTINIASGAEFREDGTGHIFVNEATTLPQRFLKTGTEQYGKVINKGVFATVSGGTINNYGYIKHDAKNAKTYITNNQTTNADFASAFSAEVGSENKMGQIDLPYSNKDEDNISISAAANQGFVSVTVSSGDAPADGKLDLTETGTYVNYCHITGGVTEIKKIDTKIEYLEFEAGTQEIEWTVAAGGNYKGLMVHSPINIKLGTTVNVTNSAYLKAKMYVGGHFQKNSTDYDGSDLSVWDGYFGETQSNAATLYITY